MTMPDSVMLLRLRQRMERLFAVHDLPLDVPGASSPWSLAMPADPDAPLDQLAAHQLTTQGILPGVPSRPAAPLSGERFPSASGSPLSASAGGGVRGGGQTRFESAADAARRSTANGSHLPYWALLWPSGLALAEALLAHPTAAHGGRTLELGCGLGTTATAALACHARLTVADCFAETLLFCRYNTLRNAGSQPRTLLIDWRTPAGQEALLATAPYDALLAADILYEQDDLDPLLRLAPLLLRPGGVFWLAEPGRRVSQAFIALAHERGWRDDASVYERIWPTETKPVHVVVHRLRLPPSE